MMIPYPVSMDQKFKKLKEQNIFGSLKWEVTENLSAMGTFILYRVV
jgi:hypothetical protein